MFDIFDVLDALDAQFMGALRYKDMTASDAAHE
jgi:hypothetical protein